MTTNTSGELVLRIAGEIPMVKLVRALAREGLMLQAQTDGSLWAQPAAPQSVFVFELGYSRRLRDLQERTNMDGEDVAARLYLPDQRPLFNAYLLGWQLAGEARTSKLHRCAVRYPGDAAEHVRDVQAQSPQDAVRLAAQQDAAVCTARYVGPTPQEKEP